MSTNSGAAEIINMGNRQAVEAAQRKIVNVKQSWAAVLKTDQNGNIINNEASTLHYRDYEDLMRDVVTARRFMNVGIQDLIGAGLSRGSDVTKTMVSYETMNTFSANVSMDGSNRSEQQSNKVINWIPQPIYTCDFNINWRQEGFSYKESESVNESVYVVNELQDKVLFEGAGLGVKINGVDAPLYGYTNHPQTITATISDWTLPANYDSISQEMIGLVGELFVGGRVMEPNSVMAYVATDIWTSFQQDYSTQKGDRTVLERCRAISEIMDIKPQKDLVAGSCVLVEMRDRTVSLSLAQQPTPVPWVKSHTLEDGRFTIYSCMVAKIKADRNGRAGVVYATKA